MSRFGKLDGADVRVSDSDRSKIAAELRLHYVEGRITSEELARRLEQAISAVTVHQLAEVVYDLPTIDVPTEAPEFPQRVRIGPPGVRPFTRRIVVPANIDRTRAVVLDTIAQGLNGLNYELKRQSPLMLEFERGTRERIVISLEERGARETTMIIHGRAPRVVRKLFARLNFR